MNLKNKLTTFDQSLNSLEKSFLTYFLGVAKPKVIFELGIHKGSTTKHIIKFLEENHIKSKIYGFDLDKILNELIQKDAFISTYVDKNILKLVGGYLPKSLEYFLLQTNPKIDFVLIDANHSYKSVLGELELLWPYISKNGFILCHDYHKVRLQYAIEHFARKKSAKFIPILNTSSDSNFQSSIAVLTKPKLKFKLFTWLNLHFELDNVRGYYFFKRIYRYFKHH